MRGYVLLTVLAAMPAASESALQDKFDAFTDARVLQVAIMAENRRQFTDKDQSLSFACVDDDRSLVALNPGGFFLAFGGSTSLKYRFDSDPYETTDLRWEHPLATLAGSEASSMARQAALSDNLVVQLGDTKMMRFDLWEARDNLAEYVRRCAAYSSVVKAEPPHSLPITLPDSNRTAEGYATVPATSRAYPLRAEPANQGLVIQNIIDPCLRTVLQDRILSQPRLGEVNISTALALLKKQPGMSATIDRHVGIHVTGLDELDPQEWADYYAGAMQLCVEQISGK